MEKTINSCPTLNVLTILTIVGSGFQVLSGVYSYFSICNSVDNLDTMSELYPANGVGTFFTEMLESISDVAVVQCEHRLLVFVMTILAAALCFWGAMLMRKLKKSGLAIYIVGELMLNLFTLFFFGATGVYLIILIASLIVPIVFIILYLVQKKNLIY